MAKGGADLNDRQRLFAQGVAKGMSATQAYLAAGYAKRGAESSASTLLRNPKVAAYLQTLRDRASASTMITVERVLERFWDIATADVNELVEHRVECCRYCWGVGFEYHYTPHEMARARVQWSAARTAKDTGTFDTLGGVGFDPHREPNPKCPECFGDGVGRTIVKDTRKLSPAAKKLYAGVKDTKDGVDLKMLDPAAALVQVARHLGMFVEKVEDVTKPIPTDERKARVLTLLTDAKRRKSAS